MHEKKKKEKTCKIFEYLKEKKKQIIEKVS